MATTLHRFTHVPRSLLLLAALLLTFGVSLPPCAPPTSYADELPIAPAPLETTPSDGEQPDSEVKPPETQPVISAQVSQDERVVVLKAQDATLASADSVAFNVWSEHSGAAKPIRHGAVQLDDGSWQAIVYIASPTAYEPGVPYNCRINRAVHRLYNPNTGQHLFSGDANEADNLSRIGWNYEGVAWVEGDDTISSMAGSAHPVFRLYNPSSGDHFYTTDANEYWSLPSFGWQQEAVAFYSDGAQAQPIYRLYNPNATVGTHHFTNSLTEYVALAQQGWKPEGICWYGAAFNDDGSWSLSGANQPLNDVGLYHVDTLATFADEDLADTPTESVIGQTTFTVTTPTAVAAIANLDNENGTFDVIVGNIRSVSGVARVEVPVWASPDQTDIIWYQASRQLDGTYKATVSARDHRLLQHYNVHVYLRTGNGLHVNAAQTECAFNFSNFVIMEGGPNVYTLSIINPGPANAVTMPTWSEANGQDDLVWYEASNRGDRWSATIDTGNLLDSGHCITHIYVDGQLRKAFGFTVSPQEVLTSRQRAIIKAAQTTSTLGGGLCAGWVSTVLMRAGLPHNLSDDANDMYYKLPLTDISQILPGMVIGVATHGHTIAGSIWGHVGIYLGNGVVIDDVGYIRRSSLDWWVNWYTDRVPVHFGFLEY